MNTPKQKRELKRLNQKVNRYRELNQSYIDQLDDYKAEVDQLKGENKTLIIELDKLISNQVEK